MAVGLPGGPPGRLRPRQRPALPSLSRLEPGGAERCGRGCGSARGGFNAEAIGIFCGGVPPCGCPQARGHRARSLSSGQAVYVHNDSKQV